MNKARDGDLYKIVSLFGKNLHIKYGYYEEYERTHGEPIPIYPDFKKEPIYTDDGYPLVTQMQELCEMGESKFKEGLCADIIAVEGKPFEDIAALNHVAAVYRAGKEIR